MDELKMIDLVLLDEKGERTAETGDPIVFLPCLGRGCLNEFQEKHGRNIRNNIIAKKIYSPQKVVCPHCGQKLKVRCYTKGDVSVEIRDK